MIKCDKIITYKTCYTQYFLKVKMNMKKIKKFEDFDRVNLFKKKFISKDYYGACNIVLSGWGTKEPPLNKDEQKLIDNFINSRSKIEQEEYNNAMRGVQGIFG